MSMRIRWIIALVGAAALAAVTLTTELPWLARHETTMVQKGDDVEANSTRPAALSCPADAKPANLAFTLKDVDNRDVTLSSFKGKVLMIDFWATWCGPCKVEIPHFVEFQERYGPQGLQIVGISIDDTAEQLMPYIRDMKMNYPVLLGLNHDDVQDAYGPLLGIPVSVLISRDGKICATHAGLTGKDVFEREIQALL